MENGFVDLRQHASHLVEESFWPSFTDIMTVVVMIFLIATSILIVRNFELVEQLQDRVLAEQLISSRLKASMEAEREASERLKETLSERALISEQLQDTLEEARRKAQVIEQTTAENATLEEQLAHAQSSLSMMRLQLMQADERAVERTKFIADQERRYLALQSEKELQVQTVQKREREIEEKLKQLNVLQSLVASQKEEKDKLERTLQEKTQLLANREARISEIDALSREQLEEILRYKQEIAQAQQQHSILVGDFEDLQDKYNKLIKPSRSAIGKYVVEVRYEKQQGQPLIRFKRAEDEGYQELTESSLHKKLQSLKDTYKDTLYVKIIIPDNSGLSYSEAWTFMSSILDKYDYYYQD